MGPVLAALLALEGVTVALAIPVALAADRGAAVAWALAALAVLLLLGAGVVRRPRGALVGWVLQAVVVAAGLLLGLAALTALGLVFLAVWVTAVVLGDKAERVRRSRSGGRTVPGPDDASGPAGGAG